MNTKQLRRTWFSIFVTFVLVTLLTHALSQRAQAKGEIIQATSLLDFANATVADVDNATYLVDKDTGEVNNVESFEDVFGEEFPDDETEALATIEEDGYYNVTNEDDDTLYVSSTFGCKRLLVNATLTSLYGAETGVTYKGDTILQFATEEDTETAYNKLVKRYGEDTVMPDSVVWAMDAHGWGTAVMGMDVQTPKIEGYIDAGTVSGDKVVVAVVDSGINPYHEIFTNVTVSKRSTVIGSAGSSYIDDDGHGTMTAGIVAESCPTNTEIMAVKVLNSKGSGSSVDCLNGIRYAVQNGADVINCSWGSKGSSNSSSRRSYMNNMDTYCKEAYDQNILVCAAAGNDGQDMDEVSYTYTDSNNQQVTLSNPNWLPAECRYVICVGALDSNNIEGAGQRSYFSNYGDAIEFTAPGRTIELASYNNNTGYDAHSGTSFASPYVAAACALLKEYDRDISFDDAVQALADISRDFGDEGWDRVYGYGMPVFTELEPLGHEWDTENIAWEWTGSDKDGYTAATATLTCKIDPEHTQVEEAEVISEQGNGEVTYTATASFEGVPYTDTKSVTTNSSSTPSNEYPLYLAFGSDRHTVNTAIGTAMAGIPKGIVSYVGLAGDLASDTTDKTSDVVSELKAALGDQINASIVDDIYGNHDENMVRDTDPDIINVDSSGSSGLVYTATDDDGNVLYYVWGIAYDDLVAKHNEQGNNANYNADVAARRAQAFKAWVAGVDPTIPVIVLSHAPLHAKRADNYSGAVWNEALNYAATGVENVSATDTNCSIIRNVVFMHGHNHTSESALRNYLPYNPSDSNTSSSKAVSFQSGSSATVTTPVYYSYMTAGYLSKYAGSVNGHSSGAYNNNNQHSTLMEITENQLKFYLFPAASLEAATVRQTIERVQGASEPRILESITVDASGAKTSYTTGESLDLSGLVVTANYSNAASRAVTNYTTDAETAVNLGKTGTYTITVSYTEGDAVVQATFTVKVTKAPVITTRDVYVQVSSLEAGGEYLIVNSNTAGSNSKFALRQSSGTIGTDAVTIRAKTNLTSDKYIAAEDVDAGSVWTASSVSGQTKLKNGNYFLQITSSSNSWGGWGGWGGSNSSSSTLSAATSETNSNGTWAYGSSALSYAYSSQSWWSTTTTTRYLSFSNNAFAASQNSAAVYLYKKTTIATPVSLSEAEITVAEGKTHELTATVASSDSPAPSVSWSSSDESVATVNAGVVTGVTEGTATITASATVDGTRYVATCEVTVTVGEAPEPRALVSISVDASGAKTAYTVGEELDLSGLVVTATYSNGDTEAVSNYSTNAEDAVDLSTADTYTVTVSYTEGDVTAEDTFEVTVAEAPRALVSISIDASGAKTAYEVGEQLDLSGLVVTATYSNGETEVVDGYTTNASTAVDPAHAGTYAVTVSYTEGGVTAEDTFEVTVAEAPRVLESIAVDTSGAKTAYIEGESLDLSGLVVTATYSNGEVEEVSGYETDAATAVDLSTAGDYTVTVSYTEDGVTVEATFGITVSAAPRVLESISVDASGAKTAYTVGEELDLSGLVVTATYSNGESEAVSNYSTDAATSVDLSTADTYTVTVSYTEGDVTAEDTFEVIVTAAPRVLESIAVDASGAKTAYEVGEQLDLSGLVVTATYSNGDSEAVSNYSTNAEDAVDLSTADTYTVTVSYTEGDVTAEDTFEVTVAEAPRALVSISIDASGAKTAYEVGEQLDLSGLVVTATYSNGDTEAVSNYSTNAEEAVDLSTADTYTVTVSYTEGDVTAEDTFEVTVAEAPRVLESIAVDTSGAKTAYTEGESLDLSGLVVTATYSNGDSEAVSNYSTDAATAVDPAHAGTYAVTVSYTEGGVTAEAEFEIVVSPAPRALVSIAVDASRAKTAYEAGERLDLSGLVVTATYSNGESEAVTGYSTDAATSVDLSKAGTYTVTVSYSEGGATARATFAVEVSKAPEAARDVYVLTDTLQAGGEYLIVNSNAAGSRYALTRTSGGVGRDAVTVQPATGATGDKYVDAGDVDAGSVWVASSSGGQTKLKNGNYFLQITGSSGGWGGWGGSSTLSAATSETNGNGTWAYRSGALSYSYSSQSWWSTTTTTRYVSFSGNAFAASQSSATVYLYRKVTINS